MLQPLQGSSTLYNAEKDEGAGPADASHARKQQAERIRVWFCLFLVLFHF